MTKHISVRVPWHDNGWNGQVCQNPAVNHACMILKNIAAERHEPKFPGCENNDQAALDTYNKNFPPCLRESGFFLSPEEHLLTVEHPYIFDSHFEHLQKTPVNIPPHSFIGIPYGWLLRPDEKKDLLQKHELFFTKYNPKIETNIASNTFISNGINQKNIFDYFWRDVVPGQSLVAAYAKAIPLTDNPSRIVVALGRVTALTPIREYVYAEPPDHQSRLSAWTWERPVTHSLAGPNAQGFIIPFAQIAAYIKEHPEQQVDDLLLFAPETHRAEFSYGCEHISSDALILLLNRAIILLQTYQSLGFQPLNDLTWEAQIRWCRERLEDIWRDRGPYPGLGSLLTALGFSYAYDIADALYHMYPGSELWEHLPEHLANKRTLVAVLPDTQQAIAKSITAETFEDFIDRLDQQGDFLRLLARMDLSAQQMTLLLAHTDLDSWLVAYFRRCCELLKLEENELAAQICENPYVLYEQTLLLPPDFTIDINTIDLALFPPEPFREEWFGQDNGAQVTEPDDRRRLRALVTYFLESAAVQGHSLCLQDEILAACTDFRPDLPGVDIDIRPKARTLERRAEFMNPLFVRRQIVCLSYGDKEHLKNALQLTRLAETGDLIRQTVEERLMRPYIPVNDNWDETLTASFGPIPDGEKGSRERESRKEKREAIQKLAASSLSVLTGGAGTGKTSTLVALCRNEQIRRGGILILAPTGKARVVLSSSLEQADIPHEAQTIFQFLLGERRCDPVTYRYYLNTTPARNNLPQTEIVDECSMLTEEMLGALFQTLANVPRVILVGDPNQLPPIGTGKPFFELCDRLSREEDQPHYASLKINNRQGGQERTDVQLAAMFSTEGRRFDRVLLEQDFAAGDGTVNFVSCDTLENLNDVVHDTFVRLFNRLEIEGEELTRFDRSLGGKIVQTENGNFMNFNEASGVENWQILTPWRNREYCGSTALNALIHETFGKQTQRAKGVYKKKTIQTLGNDDICYGEKVINLENRTWKNNVCGLSRSALDIQYPRYTANGEIGIVSELYNKKGIKTTKTIFHKVQFSSQPGLLYQFPSRSGSDDTQAILELAYALTVHKAQGSGFGVTMLILMDEGGRPTPFLSREMLYTALTRHREALYIITNRKPGELLAYTGITQSELAKRRTNLFGNLTLMEGQDKDKRGWYDERLIHRAIDGTLLRSKSELVIYNMLLAAELRPAYELRLIWEDGEVLPDFTINTGTENIYWEHLGMLGNVRYNAHWKYKKQLYSAHGISEEAGNLILSYDDPLNGALDSQQIYACIEALKRRLR